MDKDLIIKALECCYTDKRTCSDCPFQDPDKYMECANLALSALELIKELTEENERLRADCVKGADALIEEMVRSRAIKADTVREMKKRLTDFFNNDDILKYVEVDAEYINSQIDRITKEMEESL